MIEFFLNMAERRLRAFHREQGGAVALMCLAAVLILFMTVLVHFDTSKATQAKIDVQMGADTAAYSAGATGARAMNMVAFANVGKRTAVGIHNMYVFEYNAYRNWVAKMCGCCCQCSIICCPNFTCCLNCSGNTLSFIPLIEWFDLLSYMGGNDLFDNIVQLHGFQEGLASTAKRWSIGEAQARGVRNGANMIVGWPDPRRSDDRYRRLPVALSEHKSESCLAPIVPFVQKNPTTAWTTAEFIVNWRVLVDNSTSSPLWAPDGPREVADGSAYRGPGPATVRATIACAALDQIWLAFLAGGIWGGIAHMNVPDEAAPMFFDVMDSSNPWRSGDDQLRTSTMLFSYKHTPHLGRRYRENYNFMSEDYARTGGTIYPETGIWGMARGEFYFPPPNQPQMFNRGEHEMWMFHPGWMGKLRPVMLPYESTDNASESWGIEPDKMVQESLPLSVGLALGMFQLGSVDGYDGGGFANDQMYLMQISRDMKGGGSDGIEWHHYLDGTAK